MLLNCLRYHMKTRLPLFLALLLIPVALIAAEILRTDTGFYYPANKKHQDSIYYGFLDKTPIGICHLADDYDLAVGSPVYATAAGVVELASTSIPFYGSDSGAAGGAMVIKHATKDNKTFYALYGHIKNFTVAVGDSVSGGQKIAEVAAYTSNGNPEPHLHFGVNTNAASYLGYTLTAACNNNLGFVDPEIYITSNSAKLLPAETNSVISAIISLLF